MMLIPMQETAPSHQRTMGEPGGKDTKEGLNVYRYANRIPLLFEAGADVFRLNMSHGTHDEIRERHQIIRDIERDLGRPICILADLQGPKLRVGNFAKGKEELEGGGVKTGARVSV